MDKPGQVTLSDVEKAFRDLGSEATWAWAEVLDQLTRNRNGDISYYLDELNYQTTAFQVVQQHCRGYKKQEEFQGTIRFERVGDRFRLTEGFSAPADTGDAEKAEPAHKQGSYACVVLSEWPAPHQASPNDEERERQMTELQEQNRRRAPRPQPVHEESIPDWDFD